LVFSSTKMLTSVPVDDLLGAVRRRVRAASSIVGLRLQPVGQVRARGSRDPPVGVGAIEADHDRAH
jgi:hypothetical protein